MRLLVFAFLIWKEIAPTASPLISAAYVKTGHVYVGTIGSSFREITSGAEDERLPVWSRDGLRLAYLSQTHNRPSLGSIKVITTEDKLQSEIVVRYGPNYGPGIQYVESLQWISDRRIAASGSLNPSTVETLVFDTTTGKLVDQLDDDMGGAVFSPDGLHVAYVTGAPHFSPEKYHLPALIIDQKQVFPAKREQVVLLTRPLWSQDSQMLAIIAQDYTTRKQMAYIWKSNGRSETISFSMDDEGDQLFQSSWAEDTLYVRSNRAVLGFRNGRVLSNLPIGTIDDQAQAKKLNDSITRHLRAEGAQDVDLWCRACPLALLPFGQGLRVRPDEIWGDPSLP